MSNILSIEYTDLQNNSVSNDKREEEVISAKSVSAEYSENHMGCGEGRLLKLVDALENAPNMSLFVIEEPETALHQSAQHKLSEYFLDVCLRKRHQIIFTTHSTEVLSALPPQARKYIELDEIEQALVIGVEKLSKYIDKTDINTAILLGDGAGATLLGKAENKKYAQNIESIGQDGDILTSKENEKIYMDGKKIYKFGTARVAKNINALLEKEKLDISEIKYIVPHQSNQRILTSMAEKIGANNEQMYMNIANVGNTFNASIPIALNEIVRNNLLKENDKIILVGYGGGLNLGSILIEI